jgi:hypothetical protein
MKMVPDIMDGRDDPQKNGERLVFDMLARLDMDGVVLHSLLQKNHKYKMIGEVDFLMVCKYGVFCIEVKGGVIERKGGKWFSISRNGVENEIKDPFVQAKDCMYAARSYAKENHPAFFKDASCLFGYCVVFPECKFQYSGNDLVTEVLFDGGAEFGDFVKKVYEYWKSEEQAKHSFTPQLLDGGKISRFANVYRKDIQSVPSLKFVLQDVERQLIELTEEQCRALEAFDINDRVVVTGAAGTGKSVLAAEQLRKKLELGVKAAYICFNRNMARYVKDSIGETPAGYFIGTYHSLLMPDGGLKSVGGQKSASGEGGGMVSLKEVSRNSGALAEKYDYLIVDEAQDLFCIDVLDSFEKILNGGLAGGKWIMLMDRKQNIFNEPEDFDQAEEYIREACKPAYFPLAVNCRNAVQIGRTVAALTRTEAAKCMKADGGDVVIKRYGDKAGFLQSLKHELQGLLASGMEISDIVILSKYKLEKSLLNGVETLCNYRLDAPGGISDVGKGCINYFTVQSFKGLESKVVFFVDIDGFAPDKYRAINYIGMSRAKALLYMFLPECVMDEYNDLKKNKNNA